jgi:hypothetical protein
MRLFFQLVSILLSPLLAAGPLAAQAPVSDQLQLRVADSDGTAARAGSHTVKSFAIQVTDASGSGVADAAVVLHLPDTAATGTFPDGSHATVAYTDQTGVAHFPAIQWGAAPGAAALRVTATKGAARAGMLLDQTLTAETLVTVKAPPAEIVKTDPPRPNGTDTTPDLAPKTQASAASANAPARVPQPGTPEQTDRLPSPRAVSPGAPSVSVVNGLTKEKIHSGSSRTKWIIIAAIAVGAGAGIAMAGKGKSSSSSGSTPTGPTIGGGSVNVGNP